MNPTKKHLSTILMALMLALMLLPSAALAEVVEPTEEFYYLDDADVLSEATEGEIFFCNERLVEACEAEIVIVTIATTGDLSTRDYAYTLFNEWEIGGSSTKGMLLLMVIDDDDYYAMSGTWISSYFDSATLTEINDTYLEPDFAEKDYDSGAKKWFEAIYESICDQLNLDLTIDEGIEDYNAWLLENDVQETDTEETRVQETVVQETVQEDDYNSRSNSGGGGSFVLTALIIIVILIVLVVWTSQRFNRRRPHDDPPPPGGAGGAAAGFGLGYLFGRSRRARRNPPPPRNRYNGRGGGQPPRGGGPAGGAPRGGGSMGGGAPRSGGSMGGASRSGGGGSRSGGGGFGSASRSGGSPSGPSTRGSGAGRGGRR